MKLCKIYKNGKIYFYEKETKKYLLFGKIDQYGISFAIDKKTIPTPWGYQLEETIPNPPIDFYIKLGEELKNMSSDSLMKSEQNKTNEESHI